MKIKACLSHKTDIWETPKNIYNYYIEKGFFDPCPINPKFDGLKINWHIKNFVNPPYSELKKWVIKSIEEAKKGNIVILLIPARTDTKAFKLLVESNFAMINFIEGRLKFSNKNTAPFPSMFVTLNKTYTKTQFNYLTKNQLINCFNV